MIRRLSLLVRVLPYLVFAVTVITFLHTVLGEFAAVGANLVNGRTEVRLMPNCRAMAD